MSEVSACGVDSLLPVLLCLGAISAGNPNDCPVENLSLDTSDEVTSSAAIEESSMAARRRVPLAAIFSFTYFGPGN